MRKTLRLLKWIDEDLSQGIITTAKMYGSEENPEIAGEIISANNKIVEAQKAVNDAKRILAQIYEECYDD